MLKLESGTTFFTDDAGKRVCTGSQNGRPNIIPHGLNQNGAEPVKLHLERLKWVDGDYDQGGAYWGRSNTNVYIAWGKWTANMVFVQVFVRANSRKDAKILVRDHITLAKFFN